MNSEKEIELVKTWARNDIESGITLGALDFDEFKEYCSEQGIDGTWDLFSVYLDTVEGVPVEVPDEQMEICSWCGETFPHGELHNEKDLGPICDRCKNGITSRGEEFVELSESYDKKDFKELVLLADELGIKTMGDLEQFSKDHPGDLLNALREYRIELGDLLDLPDNERGITAAEKAKTTAEIKHFLEEPLDSDADEDEPLNYDDPLHVMRKLPEEFNPDFIDDVDPEDDLVEAAISVKNELDETYKQTDADTQMTKDFCYAIADEGEAYSTRKDILERVIAEYPDFQKKHSDLPKYNTEDFVLEKDGGMFVLKVK